MDPEHRRKFKDPELVSSLVKCIDFDALAPSLRERGVLTKAMIDDIREHAELDERNRRLLQRIPRRGPQAYNHFLAILRNKGMFEAVRLLTGEPLLHQEPAAPRPPQVWAAGCGSEPVVANSLQSNGHGTVGDGSEAEMRVVPATELMQGPDIYPMEQNPRGRCIIINNYEFHADPEAYRAGSEMDVCRMAELFKAFLFECTVHLNLTAEEMKTLLSEKAQEEQQKAADCLVVVLMSHGDKDTIYGSDNEELPLGDIYEMFNNDNCPVLQGKPKLFFVQTCRGRKSDIGTAKYVAPDTADAARIPCSSASEPTTRVASWLDMYICYASVPGYEAHRNTATGAWFLSAVYRVFSQYAHAMQLQKLMHRVNDEVTSQSTTDGCFQTPCNEDRGLRKELWFNPGLFKEPTV
ncbi:caspase-3-like [Haemaphysalis longicornis]